jgi:hypothetical protein
MLVKTMEGPQKTPSSSVTPLYTETLFWILQFFANLETVHGAGCKAHGKDKKTNG